MNNNQSSQIVNNSTDEIISEESGLNAVETQNVSVINSENNNSFELKKWLIVSLALVLTLTAFFLFAKETDVCLFSTCNDYQDSVGLRDSTESIGTDFIAYAGGAATLTILTTLLGVPLLPAILASAGVWFLLQIIQ